jgi:hypothetical protein
MPPKMKFFLKQVFVWTAAISGNLPDIAGAKKFGGIFYK